MNDEWTRENRIKKMNLQAQIYMPFFTVIAIFITMFIYAMGTSYEWEVKLIIALIPLCISAFTLWVLDAKLKEIDDIFAL